MHDRPASTPDQLAALLRARRKVLGLTQRAAGAGVGLLPKTISSLESAPGTCKVDSLFKLLSALDLALVVRPKADPPAGAGW